MIQVGRYFDFMLEDVLLAHIAGWISDYDHWSVE